MGTNFYLMTKNKELAIQYAPYSYELTDTPYFGYEIHIAKTSCGWLPLFQAHKNGINSVAEYKVAYDSNEFEILDEYGITYNWESFEDRVLKFNGGIRGVMKPVEYEYDKNDKFYDRDMPDHVPVSHFEYGNGKYNDDYFTDDEGYEFTKHEFC